jgi:lipopolysaccharide transport system permease protein
MLMRLLNLPANLRAIGQSLALLGRQRELTWEMTKREFSERFAGQGLGLAWAFVHPLIFVLVYVFIFAVVFRVKLQDLGSGVPADYSLYILAGLVPWLAFQEVLAKGSHLMPANANLVKQVIFPLEVLPAKTALAALLTEAFLVLVLVAYALLRVHSLPLTVVLVPGLLLVQALGMLGAALCLSALGAYFRSLRELVQVLLFVNVYFMPVLYLPDWVPRLLRPYLYMNPFSYQTWCYQDALFFGRLAHPWAWAGFLVANLLALGLGFRVFRKLKVSFGNVL